MKQVVLVVEDEPLILMGAVDVVESAGFQALEARNADEAIRLLEQRSDIALVFTDIDMPGTMDGLRLAHAIRERWPPVLLLLASGKTILEEADLPSGARFFAKPYSVESITNTMRELLKAASRNPGPFAPRPHDRLS